MLRTTAARWILKGVAAASLAGLVATAAAAGRPLGRVYDEEAEQPGVLETVGRPVPVGHLLRTLEQGAVVRLGNGQVLRLWPNSAARFDDAGEGEVAVRVLSGRMAKIGAAGRLLMAGQGSRFTLPPVDDDADAAERQLLEADLSRPARRGESERQGDIPTFP